MDVQRRPHFQKKCFAILSLLSSGLSGLILLLILIQWRPIHLLCFITPSFVEEKYWPTYFLFSALFLPLVLALLLSFLAKPSSSGVVLLSRILPIVLLLLILFLSYFLLFLSAYICP